MGTALAFLSSWFGSLLFLRDEGMFMVSQILTFLLLLFPVYPCMSSHRVCYFSLLGYLKQKGATRYAEATRY